MHMVHRFRHRAAGCSRAYVQRKAYKRGLAKRCKLAVMSLQAMVRQSRSQLPLLNAITYSASPFKGTRFALAAFCQWNLSPCSLFNIMATRASGTRSNDGSVHVAVPPCAYVPVVRLPLRVVN